MNTLFMIRERLMNINEIMESMKLITLITVPIEKHIAISYESVTSEDSSTWRFSEVHSDIETQEPKLEFSQLKLTPYSESQFRKTIKDYMAINRVTETLLAAKK